MLDSFDTIYGASVCAMCGDSLAKGRYLQVEASFPQVFCSRACLRAELREIRAWRWAARHRNLRRLAIGVILIGACLTPHQRRSNQRAVSQALVVHSGAKPGPEPLPPGWFGPDWPPTESSLLAELGGDAWIHPLAGPYRRMPRNDTRVFGAGRPGHRPWECRNGHCGVDLGGEIWGEQVRAVHDGVVEYVQRGANPLRGGRFVRIAHHAGTVITQYFHLAAIPRGLERGVQVKGGDIIGLLGDSGVKESQPHLHFSVSIRMTEKGPEKYLDPEPLVALWPLRIPLDGSEHGLVTVVAPPGIPLGSAPPRAGRGRKATKAEATSSGGPSGIPENGDSSDEAETPDDAGEE
jgi:murein DD-endopeptidase MepM/ murein hydrolase activator NlpD